MDVVTDTKIPKGTFALGYRDENDVVHIESITHFSEKKKSLNCISLNDQKEMTVEKVRTAMKGIFKSISGLTNAQAICCLEMAKVDIILNDSLVVLDGKSGRDTKEKNKF